MSQPLKSLAPAFVRVIEIDYFPPLTTFTDGSSSSSECGPDNSHAELVCASTTLVYDLPTLSYTWPDTGQIVGATISCDNTTGVVTTAGTWNKSTIGTKTAFVWFASSASPGAYSTRGGKTTVQTINAPYSLASNDTVVDLNFDGDNVWAVKGDTDGGTVGHLLGNMASTDSVVGSLCQNSVIGFYGATLPETTVEFHADLTNLIIGATYAYDITLTSSLGNVQHQTGTFVADDTSHATDATPLPDPSLAETWAATSVIVVRTSCTSDSSSSVPPSGVTWFLGDTPITDGAVIDAGDWFSPAGCFPTVDVSVYNSTGSDISFSSAPAIISPLGAFDAPLGGISPDPVPSGMFPGVYELTGNCVGVGSYDFSIVLGFNWTEDGNPQSISFTLAGTLSP